MTLSHCTLLIHCTPLIHSCILHTSHSFLHIAHLSFTPAYCTPLIHTRILHTSHSLLHIAHLSFTPAYCTPLTHSCILHNAHLSLLHIALPVTFSHCPLTTHCTLLIHSCIMHTSHSLLHIAYPITYSHSSPYLTTAHLSSTAHTCQARLVTNRHAIAQFQPRPPLTASYMCTYSIHPIMHSVHVTMMLLIVIIRRIMIRRRHVVRNIPRRCADMAVAARPLQPGDVALFIPEHLVITLDRVFESEFVGECTCTNCVASLSFIPRQVQAYVYRV